MKNILVTGGAGFIGSNFIHHMLGAHPDCLIVNFDKLTYAGNLENLQSIEHHPQYRFIKEDICSKEVVDRAFDRYAIDTVVHFAAESHVDRSIMGPLQFAQTNVIGTNILLEAARARNIEKFLHVSTDEVYGSLGPAGKFTEETPYHPNSPYSASKAAADHIVSAYFHTFGLPVVITNCSNNYGPYQFPEKLIPLMIANAINDKPLPVYGDGLNVRDWLHVKDHCIALDRILQKGIIGEKYNIGGNNEKTNIDIVRQILHHLGKPESLIAFVKDRAGHDRRYAIDASKIKTELGWEPSYTFERGISETVDWYVANRKWWERIISGEYLNYYKQQYEER
jgi:dTDP-glucose 4,6-dehydratase